MFLFALAFGSFSPPPSLWHLETEICFLQLWQSSTRFLNPVFNEMVAGREPTAESIDLSFLFQVLCTQIYHTWWYRQGQGTAPWYPKPLTNFNSRVLGQSICPTCLCNAFPSLVHTEGSLGWDMCTLLKGFLKEKIPHYFYARFNLILQ